MVNTIKQRLFFALWPDDKTAAYLSDVAKKLHHQCGGRFIPQQNIHLTLIFLGNIDAPRVAVLKQLASRLSVNTFSLQLNKLGYWRNNGIAWCGTEKIPSSLTSLVNQLQDLLKAEGFAFEQRDYVPHITLLRDARCDGAKPFPTIDLEWTIQDLVLVESTLSNQGSVYKSIGRWQLG